MRKRIYEVIELAGEGDKLSHIYDLFMMFIIFISIAPLMFKTQTDFMMKIDGVTAVIFVIDYVLRYITADYKLKRGKKSFVVYPFTVMAIIDLVSILPSLALISSGYRLLKIFRLLKTFRVFRVFKAFRYSKSILIVDEVFKKQKDSLITVLWFAVGYVLVSALVVFNVEPDTFDSFFDAIYWATISLTTMGYGDIYPVSTVGRIVTMISSLFGIAIVALPASIITAGYMEVIGENK